MQTVEATLSAWGNSTAVRIPAVLVQSAQLMVGQTIRFTATDDGAIVLRPVRERPNLDTLLAQVSPDNLPTEADTEWGAPVGTEVW